uniref:Uncharacterized protein n=1 Tax=Percolomonas cosmopolitus TaxID=63605 RepID=A0A7S1KPN4_9EUKA|eukprot:CAMPEP_0117438560 /NCGR_PEP_ID=MMETSP0759-20121206/2115_1 /TAXON_ID=63605 /ORGANISM="Percolomonas cosmopolitus, Strain WS" /LENGTH=338 /DNA_ID=CAMNT_0005230253 /DNA_START=103 /DNA_END=1119 /DNA_ORIENTATION=+
MSQTSNPTTNAPLPPKGTTKSFNLFSIPPFNPNSLPTQSLDAAQQQQNSSSLAENPLTMVEFLNLPNQQRFQYQHYLNQSLRKQQELQHIENLRQQNERMRVAQMKERCEWINYVALTCTKRCVGRYSNAEHMWREWISDDFNPWQWARQSGQQQRRGAPPEDEVDLSREGEVTFERSPDSTPPPSLSFRLWSKDKIAHTFYSTLGMAPKEMHFRNETSTQNAIYDRLYLSEEECVKECVRHMHEARDVLATEWKKHGGWEEMHMRELEVRRPQHPTGGMFGGIMPGGQSGRMDALAGTGGGLLSGFMMDRKESTLEEVPENELDARLKEPIKKDVQR